ncbi:MAG: alpha/beta hydrolase [Rhodocyclaceae bacterium]
MRLTRYFAAIALALAGIPAAWGQAVTPAAADHTRLGNISVVTQRAGPDIVLIPGLASSRSVWDGLVKRLSPTHRLHLVQIAGFADEPAVARADGHVAAPSAQAIAEYIEQQHLAAPVIIGHSLGGEVALMLAARHPAQVGWVIVVDALPFFSLVMDPNATVDEVRPRAVIFRQATLAASADQYAAMQRMTMARLARTESVRPTLVAASIQSDRATVADAAFELMTTDLRPELARIKAPVAVIYAYDTSYGIPSSVTDTTYRNAYAGLAGVRFERIDDSYHFVMFDQPARFEDTVTEIIGR